MYRVGSAGARPTRPALLRATRIRESKTHFWAAAVWLVGSCSLIYKLYLMKKIIFTLCFLVVGSLAYAQEDPHGDLQGTVVNAAGTPAADAQIRVIGLGRVVRANESGQFVLEDVTPGLRVVEVVSPRWGNNMMEVQIVAGETYQAQITVYRTYHMDDLVITAGSLVRSRTEAIRPTNVLAHESLTDAVSTTLGATLDGLPGIASTYFGPGAGRPIIRGLGGNRVSILQQNVGVADVSELSPDHSPAVDALLAERIEIIRGSATLLYGSSAVGGAVNILDGRVPMERPASAFSGTITARGGTVADERTAAAKLSGGIGKLAWRLQGLIREAGDMGVPTHTPEDDHDDHDEHEEEHEEGHDEEEHEEEETGPISVIENSSLSLNTGSFGLSWIGRHGFIGAAVSLHGTEYGVPGHEHAHHEHEGGDDHDHHEEDHDEDHEEDHDDEVHDEGVYLDMRRTSLDLAGERRFDHLLPMLDAVRARFSYTDYEHDEIEDGRAASNYALESIEGRIELDHALSDQSKGVFGVQLSTGTLDNTGAEALIPHSSTGRIGLFIMERYNTGPVGLEAGARFEYASIEADTEGQARNYSAFSVSTGINLKQSDRLAVSLSVARSVKIPNAEELFAGGVHVGTRSFEIGNPDLKTESALSMDLSVHMEREPIGLTTTLYNNRFRDFIFLRNTDEEMEGFPVYRISQGTARFLGFETEADVDLLQGDAQDLSVHVWTDYTRATLMQDDEPLPRIPPLRLGVGLSFDRGPLAAKLSLKRVRAQARIAPLEEETDGYTMLDASLRYRIFVGQTLHSFTLQGSNLTDTLARVHTSFQKEVVPLAGRDIRLTYQMSF